VSQSLTLKSQSNKNKCAFSRAAKVACHSQFHRQLVAEPWTGDVKYDLSSSWVTAHGPRAVHLNIRLSADQVDVGL